MTFLDEPSACAINVNLLANQKNDVTISTSLQVLQYLRPSTRVLTAKYSSTGKEVLDFYKVCYISLRVSSQQSAATRNLCEISAMLNS